jgi:hypothetical protein
MCLLILKPADKEVPFNHLRNGAMQNPHGSGVAIATGSSLVIQKSPSWDADNIQKVLDQYKGHAAIIHFRFATHGSKNYMNTHPFWLNDKWCAAHNGVIHDIRCHKDESDTRAFLRTHVNPLLRDGCRLDDKDVLSLLGEEMGNWNKMVYLNADGSYGIANEDSGHWSNGVWYSNYNYIEHINEWDDTCGYYCGRGTWEPNTVVRRPTVGPPAPPRLTYPYGSQKPGDYTPGYVPDNTPGEDEETLVSNDEWHRFDSKKIICDCCDQLVDGDFKINGRTGAVICDMCEFFDAHPRED